MFINIADIDFAIHPPEYSFAGCEDSRIGITYATILGSDKKMSSTAAGRIAKTCCS